MICEDPLLPEKMAKNKCQLKSVVDGRGSSSRLVYDDCVIAVFEFCAKSQKTRVYFVLVPSTYLQFFLNA